MAASTAASGLVKHEHVAVAHALDELSPVRLGVGKQDLLVVLDQRGELLRREHLRLLRVALDVGEEDDEVLQRFPARTGKRCAPCGNQPRPPDLPGSRLSASSAGRSAPQAEGEVKRARAQVLGGAQQEKPRRGSWMRGVSAARRGARTGRSGARRSPVSARRVSALSSTAPEERKSLTTSGA